MDFNNIKLPTLEEVLKRSEDIDDGKGMDKGEIESPWYSEVCPTAKDKNGNGEIKVKEGNYVNSIVCKYKRAGGDCSLVKTGRGWSLVHTDRGFIWDDYKRCDFV